MKNWLPIALSLSLISSGFPLYAESSKTYQAAIVADCSRLDKCPLMKGDTLLTSNTARSGLPLGNAMIILGLNTQVKVVTLNTQLKAFNLIKGSITVNVLKNEPRHVYQINAGNLLKIFIRQAGYYRIQISPNQKQTIVQVIQGQAELRIDKSSRVIKQGQTANIKEMDNSQIYTNVQRPLYDNDYNFSMNFIHNYYTLYPIGAPSIRLIPRYIANGPKVQIFYARPITFYHQPTRFYQEPIVIRESRYRNSQPSINIDINLNQVFGSQSQNRNYDRYHDRNHKTPIESRSRNNSEPMAGTDSTVMPQIIPDATSEDLNLKKPTGRNSDSVPVSSPDPDSTARSEIIPDAKPKNRDNIDYNAIANPSPDNKPITGTTSVVTPEAIPDATREEMNAKPETNGQVSGTTTDLTPGANSQESSKKVIEKPSEQLVSDPVTQPQIDRVPGVRTEALIPQDTRPQPTREAGIRRDPPIDSDPQTSKKIIPDAHPRNP